MAESSHISVNGSASGKSPEEEAFQKLAASLLPLQFDPLLMCGYRAFHSWIEILSVLSVVTQGKSTDGRGALEFVQAARRCGWVRFNLQREEIMVKSAVAFKVEPKQVTLLLSKKMAADDMVIYDSKAICGARR